MGGSAAHIPNFTAFRTYIKTNVRTEIEIMKKITGIFTVIFLLLFGASAAMAEQISVLGADTETKGSWTETLGKSGYEIFYGDTTETSGRDSTAQHVIALPEYVTLKWTTPGFSYQVAANPSTDERALLVPTADGEYIRRAITPYNYNRNAFNIKITDGTEHIVSFYVTSFNTDKEIICYRVTDKDGNLIEEKDFNRTEGTYIRIAADCEFNFEIKSYVTEGSLGVQGIFFDEPAENSAANFTASPGAEARSTVLSWSSEKAVSLYRKAALDNGYILIAEGLTEDTYTDTELDAGTAYSYRLREAEGTAYSAPVEASAETKEYSAVTLTALGDENVTFESFGEIKAVTVRAADSDGNPISGIKITALVDGDFRFLTSDSEKTVASGITGEDGTASLDYTVQYYGDYRLKLVSEYDDAREYASAMTSVGVSLEAGVYKAVPYLRKVSEEIEPGEIFNLYGEGIQGDSVAIKAAPASAMPSDTPPESAVSLEIIQSDMTEYGYYVSTRLPSELSGGLYSIWVKNDYGWSKPICLNGAEVLFTDEKEIYPGLEVRISGRNFLGSYFGTADNTLVRLVNGEGEAYAAVINEINRVGILFTVTEAVPPDTYTVEVSNNGGGIWSKIQSGQTMTVLSELNDPLNIKVPWANAYNWTMYYASDYGILPNTGEDLTSAIDAATLKIEKAGGGVLNLGEGVYCIGSRIALRHGVVINGAGKDKTTIKKLQSETNKIALRTSDSGRKYGLVGIANLTITADTDDAIPNEKWIMFQGYGDREQFANCSNYFVVNVDIKNGSGCSGKKYSDCVSIEGLNERLLISGCNTDGKPGSGYIRYYGRYLNNNFRYNGGTPSLFAEYSSIVGNTAINPEVAANNITINKDIHGFSIKGNTYFAENEIILGQHPELNGAGEVVMLEPPRTMFACGKVISSGESSVRIYGHESLVNDEGEIALSTPIYGEIYIAIAGGVGMGQYRRIVGTEGKDIILVEKPWDIRPDASSTYTIMVVFENTVIYKNKAFDCEASISFYSNCFNCAALENKLDTTSGISVNAFHVESTGRIAPVYNVRIEDNYIDNYIDLKDNWKGISATGQAGGDEVQIIGVEIKNNTIINSENHPLYHGETATRIRTSGSDYGYNHNVLGTILEGNKYVGFDTPILLERASGVILNGNTFEDCGVTYVTEKKSSNILYIGSLTLAEKQKITSADGILTYCAENLVNLTSKDITGTLIIAAYDKDDNSLVGAAARDITVLKHSRMTEPLTLTEEESKVLDGNIKVFFWSSLVSAEPLTDFAEATVTAAESSSDTKADTDTDADNDTDNAADTDTDTDTNTDTNTSVSLAV